MVRKRPSSDKQLPQEGAKTSKKLSDGPKRARKCSCSKCMVTSLLVVALLYITIPFVIRYNHFLQKELTYVNRIKVPFFANLSDPSSFGLPMARHFILQHSDGCHIGVWQVLPSVYHQNPVPVPENEYQAHLSDGRPVVLYLHGNTGTRATRSRIETYKLLSEDKNVHVITLDYKGFGDSTCSPSEQGVMEDGLLAWNWIRSHAPKANIYVWGHSLGSGVTVYLAANLTAAGSGPSGILLDAPFTDLIDAASYHPFTFPYWPIRALFRTICLEYLHETHSSVERVADISCPILIMHGHRDIIIPFHVGRRLYEVAVATRKPGDGRVEFIDCGEAGHKYNYLSDNLRRALDTFIL